MEPRRRAAALGLRLSSRFLTALERKGGGYMSDDWTDRSTASRSDPVRRPYFGRRLRELRSTYLSRLGGSDMEGPLLRTTPSASSLVECLQRRGVRISAAAYNEIETGLNVPRNAVDFLDAAARCLSLSAEEKSDLQRRL